MSDIEIQKKINTKLRENEWLRDKIKYTQKYTKKHKKTSQKEKKENEETIQSILLF